MAFKEGMRKAQPILLEPMMAVEVETPEEYMGDVMGDLSSRRGIIQGMDDDDSGGKKFVPKFLLQKCLVILLTYVLRLKVVQRIQWNSNTTQKLQNILLMQ